jgi:hypothetical protein
MAGPSDHPLIKAWHTAEGALWTVGTSEEFNAALARFCAATDVVVTQADRTGHADLAGAVAAYKEAIHTHTRRQDGRPYPNASAYLRELRDATLAERGAGLSALDRLQALLAMPADGLASVSAEQTNPVARAIALMLEHDRLGRPFQVQDIARAVGCNKSTLYRDQQFNTALKALRLKQKGSKPPSGRKDSQGNVDAWDEDED